MSRSEHEIRSELGAMASGGWGGFNGEHLERLSSELREGESILFAFKAPDFWDGRHHWQIAVVLTPSRIIAVANVERSLIGSILEGPRPYPQVESVMWQDVASVVQSGQFAGDITITTSGGRRTRFLNGIMMIGSNERMGPFMDVVQQCRAAAAHPLQPETRDVVSELERLTNLHSSGALSDEQFERAKEKLLD